MKKGFQFRFNFLFFIFIHLSFFSFSVGATFYVDDATCPGNSGRCQTSCGLNGNSLFNKLTIQDAIDSASDGDIIKICKGNYDESIVLEKNNITIENGSDANTLSDVNWFSSNNHVLTIGDDNEANNITIKNISMNQTSSNSNYHVIRLIKGANITLDNLILKSDGGSIVYGEWGWNGIGTYTNLDVTTNAHAFYILKGELQTFENINFNLNSTNSNYYGIYFGSGIESTEHSFTGLNFHTKKDTPIYITEGASMEFEDINITASDFDSDYRPAIFTTYGVDQASNFTFKDININLNKGEGFVLSKGTNVSYENIELNGTTGYGILHDSRITGIMSFKNLNINATNGYGIKLKNGIDINMEDINISGVAGTGYGVELDWTVTGDHQFRNLNINSSAYGIVIRKSNSLLFDNLILKTISPNRNYGGLALDSNVKNDVIIKNSDINTTGIAIDMSSGNPNIQNSKITSQDNYVVQLGSNIDNISIKDNCIYNEGTYAYHYGLYINNNNTDAVVTNNCFYGTNLEKYAYANKSGNNFSGNYWDGNSGNYDRNNVLDESTVDSCLNSCGGYLPSLPSLEECFYDDFNRTSLGNIWSIIKNKNYTPQITDNKMMLTGNAGNIAAGVSISGDFPSDNNLVEIEFEHNAYAGSGADGVTVVLSDANIAPVAGGYGGSLGYAQRSNIDGFAGGWLGFGLDEYGNFANDKEGRGDGCTYTSSTPASGTILDSVTIRGNQGSDRTQGYCFIANSGNLLDDTGTGIDDKDSDIPAPHSKYKFVIDTRNSETKITVLRDIGSGFVILPNMDEVDATQAATAPSSYKLSFTGSTGGSYNFHSFDNLKVSALSCGTLGDEPDPEQAQFDAWNIDTYHTDRFITTKIVEKSFDLTIGSLNEDFSGTQEYNGTVCTKIVDDLNGSLSDWQKLLFSSELTKDVNFDIVSANKNARVLIEWKANEDASCPLSVDYNSTISSDNFAIRPDIFDVLASSDIYSGENFTLDFKALNDANDAGSLTENYNETKGMSFKVTSVIAKSGCTNGVLNIADFSFLDGSQSVDANYSENGEVNITIAEILDREFAKVDENDTSDLIRLITPITQPISIKPYELNVTSAEFVSSNGQDWIYDANVSEMNVTASTTVQANNRQHQALQNFTKKCYSEPVDLTFYYNNSNTNVNASLSYLVELNGTMVSTLKTFADINKTITIDDDSFDLGIGKAQYSFNVDRNSSIPLSPIDITLTDVKVTSTDVAKNENNATLNDKMTFYYGRVSTKDITTNLKSVNHTAKIEVYDSNQILSFKQNSINWYEMEDDNQSAAYSIIAKKDFVGTQYTLPNPVTIDQNTSEGVINLNIVNTWTSSDSSYIHLDIPDYLWYNRYSDYNASGDCSTHPCFRYIYNISNSLNNINSGTFDGSSILRDQNYTGTYEKTGVKTFR